MVAALDNLKVVPSENAKSAIKHKQFLRSSVSGGGVELIKEDVKF